MRKWLLMGVSYSLVAALVLVASAAAAKGKPHKAASRVTSALTVSVNQTTGVAKATGLVKVNGKKVPTRWHNVATRSDSWGNVCGGKVQPYTTSSFKAKDFGSYRLKFSLRTTKKYNGRYYTRTKTVTLDNESDRAQCAGLPAQPVDASSICAWGTAPANPDPTAVYCGMVYPGAPAFKTPLTMAADMIHIGQFGSPSKDCQLTVLSALGKLKPTYKWLGGSSLVGLYRCTDGTGLNPEMHVYFYPRGSTSYCTTHAIYAVTAQLDPDWDGTVYVELDAGTNGRTIIESSRFDLHGTVNPCTALGLPMISAPGPTG